MKKLLLVLVLSGCGQYAYHYDVPGLGSVESDLKLSVADITSNMEVFRDLAVDKYQVIHQDRFDTAFQDVKVEVLSEETFPVLGVKTWGVYNPVTHTVTVGKAGLALAHELLHAYDQDNGCPGTIWHQGWDQNYYNAIDYEYSLKAAIY